MHALVPLFAQAVLTRRLVQLRARVRRSVLLVPAFDHSKQGGPT